MTAVNPGRLVDLVEYGLDSPICLNCRAYLRLQPGVRAFLSSSGRRDARELSPRMPRRSVIDELQRMQVFYVNVGGGGEPTARPDFWHLLD